MPRKSGTTLPPMSAVKANMPHDQGLTLVHFSAQRKHILWDALGA